MVWETLESHDGLDNGRTTVAQIFWVALWSHQFLGRTVVWWSHYGLIRGLWVARWSDQTRVEVFGQIFVRNAVNAVNLYKKCGDWGEWGENEYFTAFHRISYKSSPRTLGRAMVWPEVFWVALWQHDLLGCTAVWSEGKVWKMVWSERSTVAHLNLGIRRLACSIITSLKEKKYVDHFLMFVLVTFGQIFYVYFLCVLK